MSSLLAGRVLMAKQKGLGRATPLQSYRPPFPETPCGPRKGWLALQPAENSRTCLRKTAAELNVVEGS